MTEAVVDKGALDNASGVAALLGIAEAFVALPARPRRSIRLAAVAAEEQGLLGSGHLTRHPPAPAGRLAANINMDGREWEDAHYHQPSDDLTAEWDLAEAVEDAQLLFHVGAKVADAPLAPAWRRATSLRPRARGPWPGVGHRDTGPMRYGSKPRSDHCAPRRAGGRSTTERMCLLHER